MLSWQQLLNHQRLGKPVDKATTFFEDTGRSMFESDVDRASFCVSFRRLARKTQVFPLVKNDHIHNRLTHSLEVSRVGRSLGTAIGRLVQKHEKDSKLFDYLSPREFGNIVEAASLIHDIGHPPFGHAGDRAIMHWFNESPTADDIREVLSTDEYDDLSNFEGNAQGFRCITQLEKNRFSGGLNLTFATLASYVKYPNWSVSASRKRSVFLSEKEILEEVAKQTGLFVDGIICRHPLSFVLEAADDICYGLLDLEDAVEIKLLDFGDVVDNLLQALPETERESYRPSNSDTAHRIAFSRMRGKIFRAAIVDAITAFERNYQGIMEGSFNDDLLSDAAANGSLAASTVLNAKERAKREIFPSDGKANIELSSFAILARLLEDFLSAAIDFAKAYKKDNENPIMSMKSSLIMDLFGDDKPKKGNAPAGRDWTAYECLRRSMDFVTGMTDNYALEVFNRLSGHIDQ